MDQLTRIDKTLDEALVNLGAIVLRLSDPAVTRTAQERRALARSVNQFSLCADHSGDPRVQRLRVRARGDDPAQITAGVGLGLQAAEDSDVSFIQWTMAGQCCSSTRLPMNSPR